MYLKYIYTYLYLCGESDSFLMVFVCNNLNLNKIKYMLQSYVTFEFENLSF